MSHMNWGNGWLGLAAMFALAAAIFAFNFWSIAARKKAIKKGNGLGITQIGIGMVGIGLVIGATCLIFGEVPPLLTWWDVGTGALLGAAVGLFAARRMTVKWDRALQENHALKPHVVAWWESQWVALGIMIVLLMASLLYPGAVGSLLEALGNLSATSGYFVSGLSLVSGLLIVFWAKRRARQYGKPITLPMLKR